MNTIYFTNNLNIKKIEAENEKDWWMIHQLEQDPLVSGKTGYLWHLSSTILNSEYRYLEYDDIYNSPFSIYHGDLPIGFLEVSPIYQGRIRSSVELSYAILKKERKKGYMKSVLTNVSDYILEDMSVDEVDLIIHSDNIASRLTASASGFTGVHLSNSLDYDDSQWVYRKTKNSTRK